LPEFLDLLALVHGHAADHVGFAGLQGGDAGGFLGVGLEDHRLVGRFGAVVLVEGFQHDLITPGPLLQPVGAAADGIGVVLLVAHFLDVLGRYDGQVVPQHVETGRIRLFGFDGEGVVVDDGQLGEGRQLALVGAFELLFVDPVVGKFHGSGVHRFAVVKNGILAQGDLPGQIVDFFPLFRQGRQNGCVLLGMEQGVVDVVTHAHGGLNGTLHQVETDRFGLLHHHQGAGVPRRGRGGRQGEADE
jgi:hypothetical protein